MLNKNKEELTRGTVGAAVGRTRLQVLGPGLFLGLRVAKLVWFDVRRILEYEGSKFVSHLELTLMAASLACLLDGLLLLVREESCLRIVAARAQYKLLDEHVQQILQFGGIVGAVHNVPATTAQHLHFLLILELKMGYICSFYQKQLIVGKYDQKNL